MHMNVLLDSIFGLEYNLFVVLSTIAQDTAGVKSCYVKMVCTSLKRARAIGESQWCEDKIRLKYKPCRRPPYLTLMRKNRKKCKSFQAI